MRYFGGKGGCGVYQQVINLMPAHEIYIETHLGGGNILLRKRPAPRGNIAIELDARALLDFRLQHVFDQPRWDGVPLSFVHADCVDYLRGYRWTGKELVYADPPYLMATRKSKRTRYAFEYTQADHVDLLSLLLTVPADVMISGYPSELYDDTLSQWHTHTFTASTRRGTATEKLWMNFDPSRVLKHEYTYAGDNFRERERIRRKASRWVSNLERLAASERNFILQEISSKFAIEFHHHSTHLPVPDREPLVIPAEYSTTKDIEPAAPPETSVGSVPAMNADATR